MSTTKSLPRADLDLLTVDEAAEYLNVSPRWIRRSVEEQRFPVNKLARHVRIRRAVLDAYLEANERPARKPRKAR